MKKNCSTQLCHLQRHSSQCLLLPGDRALQHVSDSASRILPEAFLWTRLFLPAGNELSDDFPEGAKVKEEKQMKEPVSKCCWLGKTSQELIIQSALCGFFALVLLAIPLLFPCH